MSERIAVFSDIHGNLPALEACVADAEAQGCTGFANLGDILSGPLWPHETAEYLMQRDWPTIAGNHERYVLTIPAEKLGPSDSAVLRQCSDAQIAWLASHPPTMTLPGAWCTHARPGVDDDYLIEIEQGDRLFPAPEEVIEGHLGEERHALVLHGHSHLQRMVTLSDGRRIANPGSTGLPGHFADEPGSPDARYLILSGGTVELRAVPYDFEPAARQAEANKRKSWGRYLREGLPR